MAHILRNGTLKIVPQPPRHLITAFRDLTAIRRELESFHDRFRTAPATKEAILPTLEQAEQLRTKYVETLKEAGAALEGEMGSMSEEARAYYQPVLIFIWRASDAHTVVPFLKYADMYYGHLDEPANGNYVRPFGTLDRLRGFAEERISDSIATCESYACLLSSSFDSFARVFDIGSLASEVFHAQRGVSQHNWPSPYPHGVTIRGGTKDWERHEKKYDAMSHRWNKMHKDATLEIGQPGSVSAIKPLLHFLLSQIISNAFKASFGAAGLRISHKEKANGYLDEAYKEIELPAKPFVRMSIDRISAGEIGIVVEDNGIGIPAEKLEAVFSPGEHYGTFFNIRVSNGNSTKILPFIADLTGITIEVSSELGKGTKFDLTIPTSMRGE
jgi:hypothetical protein